MSRNHTLDQLRGLAALMVSVHHLSLALPDVLQTLVYSWQTGVQMFFVISGYIIPYSMAKSGYRTADIGRFWLKRLLRLQPSYTVALLFTFAISCAAAVAKGASPEATWWHLLQGLFYFWVPAENPVIWTLIVEMKYYLFISIFFPLLFSPHRALCIGAFCVCGAAAAFGAERLEVLRHLPFFLFGFVACNLALSRITARESILLMLLAAAAALPRSTYSELAAGLICYLAIRYLPPLTFRAGMFLGTISYSLYLIHFPLGVKLVNLMLPHTPPAWRFLWTPVGTTVCVLAAYVVYRLVEKPSSKWSQRIRLSGAPLSPAAT